MKQATCHPFRKHYAKGMCQSCYYAGKQERSQPKAYRDSQPGLVRVNVRGWGCVS